MTTSYETDLSRIAAAALEKEEENDHFLRFIKRQDGADVDALVHRLNDSVSAAIDCTQCGNCCKTLVINITGEEIEGLSAFLGQPVAEVEEQYIEKSMAGRCFMNTIPCHFLSGSKCTIYPQRFTECRDFPHLHKNGFKERLAGTLLHYGSCPIIYNVIEAVKKTLQFKEDA